MSVNYEVDYSDPRLKAVDDGRAAESKDVDDTFDPMISDTQEKYDALIDASKQNAETQSKLQQEQTDFAIKQIEQQKNQAQKDYQKEQVAAYTDYQKQIDPYGVNAEQMAAQGLSRSGYSESSKVSMYNTYQNRVATAREAFENAKVEYNNAITEAKLQNSSILAEIAASALETQLTLSLEGFQYKNSLILQKADAKNAVNTKYDNKRLSVLDQINTENALTEEARQFDILHPQDAGGIKGDNNGIISPVTGDTTISTKYYNGQIAENVGGFGYMGKDNNGIAYQPRGVYINGTAYKLNKYKGGTLAKKVFGKDFTNSSGVNASEQNIWEANGKYFIWNGTKNMYEEVSLE